MRWKLLHQVNFNSKLQIPFLLQRWSENSSTIGFIRTGSVLMCTVVALYYNCLFILSLFLPVLRRSRAEWNRLRQMGTFLHNLRQSEHIHFIHNQEATTQTITLWNDGVWHSVVIVLWSLYTGLPRVRCLEIQLRCVWHTNRYACACFEQPIVNVIIVISNSPHQQLHWRYSGADN